MSNLLNFSQRAESMGLTDMGNDIFQYNDSIGSVKYCHLQTKDLIEIPLYGIFTKPPVENTNFIFAGYVSELYQFEGNEVMNQKIRTSIGEIGTPILREYVYINPLRTRMSNEIIIQHKNNIPTIGDVYPNILVKNTYDGSGAREFVFGFSIFDGENRVLGFGFSNKISKIKQVHNINARTSLTSPIGRYVEIFNQNILSVIDANLSNNVTEEDLLRTLDLIEEVGKKRRTDISSLVDEMSKETDGRVNSWSLFSAIAIFSSIEKNVNIRSLLDNIAERVLVIPVAIDNVLKTLNG